MSASIAKKTSISEQPSQTAFQSGQPAANKATGAPESKAGSETIDAAYAVVPAGGGLFRAVRLRGVIAEHVDELVPSIKTQRAFAMQRALRTMEIEGRKLK